MALSNSNNKVKVAVIDSGISKINVNFENSIKFSTGFSIIDGYIREHTNKPIENMHGTVIAETINHVANFIDFYSINVFNAYLSTDFRILLYSLYYVIENLDVDIIHLSLMTRNHFHWLHLRDIVKAADKKNIIIVASADNRNRRSYPAAMKGVIGVKAVDKTYKGDYYYDRKYFLASTYPFGHDSNNKDIFSGSSIAAGYITGHLAKIIKTNGLTNKHNIVSKLITQSNLYKAASKISLA